MVTTREDFQNMRNDYLNSDLAKKADPAIKHIEKTLLNMIDSNNNNLTITIPDALWGKHVSNIRQMDILKTHITNQYKRAGWTHVSWRMDNDPHTYHSYSITIG